MKKGCKELGKNCGGMRRGRQTQFKDDGHSMRHHAKEAVCLPCESFHCLSDHKQRWFLPKTDSASVPLSIQRQQTSPVGFDNQLDSHSPGIVLLKYVEQRTYLRTIATLKSRIDDVASALVVDLLGAAVAVKDMV